MRANAAGQLGTATAASGKGASSNTGDRGPKRFRLELRRQQREIRELRAEVRGGG